MINVIAYVLIAFSILQIFTGIAIIIDKFDPLLPKERKKLPAKHRKKAKMLNAISMIVTSLIFIAFSIGILLNSETVIVASAVSMATFIIIMLPISIYTESKLLNHSKK